jgi:hypothetical protein
MRFAWAALLLTVVSAAQAQLSLAEHQGIQETLYLANLTEDDLKFSRRTASDGYAMPLVNLAVDDPLTAADRLMALHLKGSGSLCAALAAADESGFDDAPLTADLPKPVPVPATVPLPLQAPVGALIACIRDANVAIRNGLSKLTPAQRRSVIESLPRLVDPDSTVTFDFVHEPQLSKEEILSLVKEIDLKAIRMAGVKLATQVERVIPQLKAFKGDLLKPLSFQVDGMTVELGGRGDDRHTTRNSSLCIDLGGDNTYSGRYGAGVGYASVLIDLGSHSRFEGPDLNYGAGVLGIGLAYVQGGDAEFDCRSLCLGAGIGGVGGFSKAGGNDTYRANSLCQGAAAFGLGVMLDSSGDDQYTAKTGAQGYARTQGVGWLIDQSGDDTYRVDRGQGCGEGFFTADGAVSGGIGLLTDLSGKDIYLGGDGCQAAGIGAALGSLFDQSGADTYSASDEAQAFASRTGAAFLFDLAGNDTYSLHGSLGQAMAAEHSVALLLDREGDDLYTSLDAHPGSAISGGLAMLIDAGGDDRYQGRPGVGIATLDKVSLGLFADLGGANRYSDGLADEQASISPGRGVAFSAPTSADLIHVTTFSDHKTPPVGTKPIPPDNEMESLYRSAVGADQDFAASDALVSIGEPALKWIVAHKLDADDPGRDLPFYALLTSLGAPARAELAQAISDPNDARALGAIEILRHLRAAEVHAQLDGALKRTALQVAAADTAAQLGFVDLSNSLLPLLASSNQATVLAGLTALGTLRTPEGVGTAQVYLNTTDLPIREAAMRYMAEFPGPALAAARARLGDSDERISRLGIELLGRVGTPESLSLVLPYLNRGSVGMKIQALLALDGRCPPEGRAAFLALRDDINSLVRAVALRTDPGR